MIDQVSVERFLVHEANLLDERRFEEWSELFVDDGYYWVPARPDQDDPRNEVSLLYDDKNLMRMRIKRLRHPQIHAQTPPARAIRLVSNFLLEADTPGADETSVVSKFVMLEFRPSIPDPTYRYFGGSYKHRLKRVDQQYKIVSKKVDLLNCDSTFEPLALYF